MKLQLDDYLLDFDLVKGKGPCVIFCHGFNSSKIGDKALALKAFCEQREQEFIRFDYSGHGESGGEFADGSITNWLNDTLAIIDQVTKKDVVLVGSSMGGWISLLAALLRPERVRGLLLLACAVDMTKYYSNKLVDFDLQSDSTGRNYYSIINDYDDRQPYLIYKHLIDDGRQHYLLHERIGLNIPIQIVHGVADDVIPWQRSQDLLQALDSNDTNLHLIKSGDHRLSRKEDITIVISLLRRLLELE